MLDMWWEDCPINSKFYEHSACTVTPSRLKKEIARSVKLYSPLFFSWELSCSAINPSEKISHIFTSVQYVNYEQNDSVCQSNVKYYLYWH